MKQLLEYKIINYQATLSILKCCLFCGILFLKGQIMFLHVSFFLFLTFCSNSASALVKGDIFQTGLYQQ